MKKKYIVVFVLLAILSTSVFASFLQIGPTYSVNTPVDFSSQTPIEISKVDFNKYTLGLDTRFNIGYVVLEGECKAKFTDELLLNSFDVYTSLGLKVKVFFLDFIASLGLKTEGTKNEASNWIFNGVENPTFVSLLTKSSIFYKLTTNINMGKVTLSLNATLPTTETIETLNEVKERSVVDALTPQLDKTLVSVGLLFNLF